MKKNLTIVAVCAAALLLAACGKTETAEDSHTEPQAVSAEEQAAVTEEAEAKSGGAENQEPSMEGVYEDAESFAEIPMGYLWEGEQKTFCKVTLPAYRITSFAYIEEGGSEGYDTDFSSVTVERAIEKGLLEQPYVTSNILMTGNDARTNMYYVYPSTLRTMDDERAYAEEHGHEYFEIDVDGHRVLYYVDNSEYGNGDLCISYELNGDMILLVRYADKVTADISTEQLVRNFCSTIEVVE